MQKNIRNDQSIQGFNVITHQGGHQEVKTSQYADDGTLIININEVFSHKVNTTLMTDETKKWGKKDKWGYEACDPERQQLGSWSP